MRAQVLELREHVLLDQRVEPRRRREFRVVLADDPTGALGVAQPAPDRRQARTFSGCEQRLHRAAVANGRRR